MRTIHFLILWSLLATAPLEAAEIAGRVTDSETLVPVANAQVRVLNADLATRTDRNGEFLFTDLNAGTYTIAISHIAYLPAQRTIGVTGTTGVVIGLSTRTYPLGDIPVIAEPFGAGDIHRQPAYATVITRESFEGRQTTMPDVLAEATGVHVKRLGGLGAFSTISLRGSSADQVEVYLDGILLNAAFGGGVDLGNLPLAHVGQIEVYRGAGAGGNGMGGAVHVRTRRLQRRWQHGVRGSWGAFDTRLLSGVVSGTRGKSEFLAVADYAQSDNDFRFMDDNGTEYNTGDDVWSRRRNNDHRSINLLGKWRRALGENSGLSVHETLYWKAQGIPGISNNQSRNAQLDAFRTMTEITYENRALSKGMNTHQSLYVTHTSERFRDLDGEVGIGRQDNEYRTRTYGWRGRLQTVLLSRCNTTAVVSLRREAYAPKARIRSIANFFDSRRWSLSARAGVDVSLPWNIGVWSAGAERRLIHSSFTGANPFDFSPLAPDSANTRNLTSVRTGVRLDLTSHLAFKANAGRVFRIPSFFELFGDRGGVVGNVNLRPEYGFAWDAGIRYSDETNTLELAFFDQRYEDLIQFVHTSQATSRPVNIGKARVYGLELTAQRRFGAGFSLSGNYTFQDARDRSAIPYLTGNILPNRPPHALFARATARLGRWTLVYDYSVEDGSFLDQANRRPLTMRQIHNAGVKVDAGMRLQIGLEARNLTGAQIADTWGFPLPGRAFFVSIKTEQAMEE
ncbi:MAG: TonB-dependent receptor [Gemmatimonadota bacterium]|nr:TonB-dependent receptor [Gemmatimonadota bacterium]